jgi:3-hydroxyisobutyrate dehydrogenase-like beta-hydroxyacid dehydrogenase
MKPGAIVRRPHDRVGAGRARAERGGARARAAFIDAPVSGGNVGAINGALTVMCGGDAAAFERCSRWRWRTRRPSRCWARAARASSRRWSTRSAIAGWSQGLSEAIAFGRQAGLDMKLVLDVIGKGAAQSWQMDNRGPTMLDGKFDFGFAVDWMRKDLGLVLDEAQRNGARLPVTALVDQFYADVQALGGNRLDTSSLLLRLTNARPKG